MDKASPAQGAQKPTSKTAFAAFFLVAFSCLFGLSFCLIKSPQARAEAYLATAVEALSQNLPEQAAQAAIEAVRLNPMLPQGWEILSKLLQQNGQDMAAAQAQSIAAKVQQNPSAAPVIYAMPAEFKLSLLALAQSPVQ